MRKVVVVTGGGAGVGRAAAREFARQGCDVAILSRDPGRLDQAVRELHGFGVRALGIPTDVADAAAVDAAADRIERELGPIAVWVNVAMATVFAPVRDLTAAEVERGTAVTYLGQVHGIMAALRHMRPRNRGSIVCVGSALAYRAIPLQAVYCGAKFAIRGFLDSLRSELRHDRLKITLTEIDLPAVNTPQFDWARNKTTRRPQPVPPIFQPEVAARAICFGAFHPRRQIWVGSSTVKAILANSLFPGLLDRYLAKAGYSGQLTDQRANPAAPDNLFEAVQGDYAAHGRFDDVARDESDMIVTSRHRALACLGAALGLGAGLAFLTRRALARNRAGTGRPPAIRY